MWRSVWILTMLWLTAGVQLAFAAVTVKDKVVVIPLKEATLTVSQELYQLGKVLDKVRDEGAAAVVFEINVTTGDSVAAAQVVREKVASIGIPVASWVNPSATGAGALFALGSDAIFMSSLGTLGGIVGAGDQAGETKEDSSKTPASEASSRADSSALRAAVRVIAEAKGHDVEISSAFVDPSVEIDGVVEKGTLLTLTASQAGTFAQIANSVEEVVNSQGLSGVEQVRVDGLRNFLRAAQGPSEVAVEAEAGSEPSGDSTAKRKGDGLFSKAEEDSFAGKIVVIEIVETDELLLEARFEWFERAIQKASDDGASAVILDMNTPGGRLWETQELMMSILAKARCQTITFVNPNAISAGAMIAISTDDIYMAPAAVIGAATAVSSLGGDIGGAMEGKIRSVQVAAARNVASLKGHNPDIAEAFVAPEKVLQLGPINDGPDSPLTLNADDAVQIVNGKPLLAKGIATSVEEIIELEGLVGEVYRPEPYGLEQFAIWVERLSSLLIFIGIAGAYLEIKSPGFGIPGLIAVLAFTVFFFGNYMAGNLAGWEVAVVFILGVILVVVEIFVLPGTMIAGGIGMVLIVGALGFAMVDRVDLDLLRRGTESAPGFSGVFLRPALNLVAGLLLAAVLVILGITFLPQTRLMNWMVLDSAVGGSAPAPGLAPQGDAVVSAAVSLVGKTGVAFTELRPSGKATIDGDIVDVTAGSEFVERGGHVRIVSHEGSRIVVEPSE